MWKMEEKNENFSIREIPYEDSIVAFFNNFSHPHPPPSPAMYLHLIHVLMVPPTL